MRVRIDKKRKKKFVVDKMYFKLARWLRMLGYDAIYDNDMVDINFIWKADREDRIILTRDEDLKRRAEKEGIQVERVDASTLEERLVKLHLQTGIELALPKKVLPRCTQCNAEIKLVDVAEIKDELTKTTMETFVEYWICQSTECKQIYWRGSHWDKMEQTLKNCNELLRAKKGKT